MDSLMLLTLLDLNIPKSQYHGCSITKTKILSTEKRTQKKDKQGIFGGPSLLFTIYKQQLF